MIGAFADLVFEVSGEKVLTFDEFKHDVKSRYARHELINQPPVLEWLGSDTQKITLTVTLTTALNVNPADEIETVKQLCLDGVADWLIIGNEVVGATMWVITDASTKATAWDGEGNIIVASMDLTFESYVAEVNET